MNELIEEQEEPKTHSIVTGDCKLRLHHVGLPVTYKGVTGLLIRYIPECGHKLMDLSLSEVKECLELNAPADTDTVA